MVHPFLTDKMSKVSKLVKSSDGCEIFAEGAGNLEGSNHYLGSWFRFIYSRFQQSFSKTISLLSKVYLVRYDMRSHGRSARPVDQSDYSSPNFAADFTAVAEGFNRKKPYVLGWSLGGKSVERLQRMSAPTVPQAMYRASSTFPRSLTSERIMMDLGKQCLKDLHPRLLSQDVADALKARIDFVDSTINDCNASNWDDRLLWVGAFSHLNANDVLNAMSRQQDPEPLFAAGRQGLRLLHVYGDADQQLDNVVAEAQVSQHFINKRVVVIKGGGHALFYEFQGQVVEEVLAFVTQ
ncbi:Alpha/Beta hydrolase protein [Suillus occidentalis]|nr:Alpha/Beta hydrolase protein [Suillus occidentalis]